MENKWLYVKRHRTEETWVKIGVATDMDDSTPVGSKLVLVGFGYYVRIKIPHIIKPKVDKVYPTSWSAEDIERLGRDHYLDHTPREYSISMHGDHVSVYYGLDSGDSNTQQQFGFFIPWMQWKYNQRTIYNPDGTIHATFIEINRRRRGSSIGHTSEDETSAELQVPKLQYKFTDYDGEEIVATCHVEERVWSKGESRCSWLRFFFADLVVRRLEINFSKGVGSRKNSWKGGWTEHSVVMEQGDSVESAFKRYCLKNKLTFTSEVTALHSII